MRPSLAEWAALLLGAGLTRAAGKVDSSSSDSNTNKRPNILFILTDDQDWHMESVDHMPHLKADVVGKGVTYARHFCTVALCCPSRATLWTGKAAHNHNVTDVKPPHGGYPKVVAGGVNDDYLPLWLQEAGYNTYYAGKLWNFHSVSNYDSPAARGFNGSAFLLDPYTYRYWDSRISHDGGPPVSYAGRYSTDVVAESSYALLERALAHEEPWFLTVAPTAPHSNWVLDERTGETYLVAPQVAYRHEHLFHDYQVPRGRSFNTPIRGAAGWPGRLEALNESVLAYNDFYQCQRLRALQPVDEMLHELVERLTAAGQLDNTYIFYSTDNGYHISQHAMHPGKECGLDTDVHIPLFVRGPGLPDGGLVDIVTTHTDLAPTFLQIAGAEGRLADLDGEPIPLGEGEKEVSGRAEHIAVEYWGYGVPEGHYGFRSDSRFEAGVMKNIYVNNTYRGLRVVAEGYSLYYSVWCTGERELYDMVHDAEQTINLLAGLGEAGEAEIEVEVDPMVAEARARLQVAGRSHEAVVTRLETLIMVLRDCKGEVCRRPWKTLHPDGRVESLARALDPRFDGFYEGQPRMNFDGCQVAYFEDKETSAHVHPYDDDGGGDGGLDVESEKQWEYQYGDEWVLAI